MDGRLEVAVISNQGMSNTLAGDVLLYAACNAQNVCIGQSNATAPALKCSGANVTTGGDLTVNGNFTVLGSYTQLSNSTGYLGPGDWSVVCEQAGAGGWAGALTVSGWVIRNLNQLQANQNNNVVSATGGTVWVKPGTYETIFSSVGYGIGGTKTRLRNATTATDLVVGQTGYTGTPAAPQWGVVEGYGLITVSGAIGTSNALQLGLYGSLSNAASNALGFGVNISSTYPEIFSQLMLRRVA